jgi:predicted phosphodiesterase
VELDPSADASADEPKNPILNLEERPESISDEPSAFLLSGEGGSKGEGNFGMRVAVISDIHGESYPLDVALQDIRRKGVERFMCLGDAVQGGSQPKQTVARLRELECPIVMGNADAWLLSGENVSPNEKTTNQQVEVRDWSLSQLSEADLSFIREFKPMVEIPLEKNGRSLLCFHGSPKSFNDIILPETTDDAVRGFMSGFEAKLFSGGHTHTQQLRLLGGGAHYINPGSVSLPFNWDQSNLATGEMRYDCRADYAIVSSEGDSLEVAFCHVVFDYEKLARIVRGSGRPYAEQALANYVRERR